MRSSKMRNRGVWSSGGGKNIRARSRSARSRRARSSRLRSSKVRKLGVWSSRGEEQQDE